ncbi:hypothetical protein ATANTOWER_028602 [Ataeniobius toweri]|uniref:Uncharacterized protein n=1 Tax=Ataeniobius toweri TaxID=208326 RepID=A0ABU7BL06_9TELE|nr:hypothetical protein [Ataeniobius toweri]
MLTEPINIALSEVEFIRSPRQHCASSSLLPRIINASMSQCPSSIAPTQSLKRSTPSKCTKRIPFSCSDNKSSHFLLLTATISLQAAVSPMSESPDHVTSSSDFSSDISARRLPGLSVHQQLRLLGARSYFAPCLLPLSLCLSFLSSSSPFFSSLSLKASQNACPHPFFHHPIPSPTLSPAVQINTVPANKRRVHAGKPPTWFSLKDLIPNKFALAFSLFRNTICSVYSHRPRGESSFKILSVLRGGARGGNGDIHICVCVLIVTLICAPLDISLSLSKVQTQTN